MRLQSHRLLFVALFVLSLPSLAQNRYKQIEVYQLETSKLFDEVVADAEFAIGEQNFVLTARYEIGKTISQQSKEPFPEITVLQFCNLEQAREILTVSPEFSLHMPCKISIYQQSELVIIQTVLPTLRQSSSKQNKRLKEIKDKLRTIINFAAQTH